jgi:uncharacterized membrane protein
MLSTEKRLSREEEERLWIMSVIPLVPVLVGAGVYIVHLKSIGVISSVEDAFRYVLLVVALYLVAGFGIYEVASSFKVKRAIAFRVKRFLSRTVFASGYVLCFYALSSFFTLLFSAVLRWQYILILSLLTLSLTMLALLQNPKARRVVKRFTQEES